MRRRAVASRRDSRDNRRSRPRQGRTEPTHSTVSTAESKARIEAEFANGYVRAGEVRWRWLSVCPHVVTVLGKGTWWLEGGRHNCYYTLLLLEESMERNPM